MPNTHENQVDTSASICTNKETISPPRLSSIKQNVIPIKQEQESLYEPEFIPNFSNNNGSRVRSNIFSYIHRFDKYEYRHFYVITKHILINYILSFILYSFYITKLNFLNIANHGLNKHHYQTYHNIISFITGTIIPVINKIV